MLNFVKNLLKKEVVVTNEYVLNFEKRNVDLVKLLPTEYSAQMWYNLFQNKYIDALTQFDQNNAKVYHDLLISIKQMAEKNGYQVK